MNIKPALTPAVKKYLPWLTALAIFMQSLDGTILNTALPSIAKDLNRSPLSMQSIIVSYTLTLALFIPLSGWLSDKFGTKKIFCIAISIFTLGSLCCAISNTLPLLVLSRVLQAVGGSMMVPVARLAILYTYPKKLLLKVINFITIPGLVGPVIGPSLGGWLVDLSSWHWIFLVNIPVGLLGIWLATFAMPDIKRNVYKFDYVGFILFSGALTILTLSMELGSMGIVQVSHIIAIIIIAASLIYLYVKHAKKTPFPLIKLTLFKIRTLKVGLVGNLATRLGIGGLPLFLPLMLQIGFGYSASVSGMMLIPSALANLMAKPLVLPLVKNFGYKNTLISNTIILSIIIALFSLTTRNTPLYYFIPLLIIFGMVSSIQFTSMNTISIADLDESNSSEGNSVIAVTQQLSISFGISIGSLILMSMSNLSFFQNKDIAYPFKATFLILGIITLFSSLVFTNLKSTDGNKLSGNKN